MKRLPSVVIPYCFFQDVKKETYRETRLDVNRSKVRVNLHLWLQTLNFAWTLRWQCLTLSWSRRLKWSQTVGSN